MTIMVMIIMISMMITTMIKMMMMITMMMMTPQIYNRVREGNFLIEGVPSGMDMWKKTVGVLGTGRIGEAFIHIAMGASPNICRVETLG
jgi:D-lactate dehydrogenase